MKYVQSTFSKKGIDILSWKSSMELIYFLLFMKEIMKYNNKFTV